MKKKTKKLVLAKETVRELTNSLERVAGGSDTFTCHCPSEGPYLCDMPVTTSPTCVE